MNFEFSPEQRQLRDQARRFFAEQCPPETVRAVLDGQIGHHAQLWQSMADMGFMGVTIPETYGGLGLGYLELCVIAEECGRALLPLPFSSSAYIATEFLLIGGSQEQKDRWLPLLASGKAIGTFAYAEGSAMVTASSITARYAAGYLHGVKLPVPDGSHADFAIVAAKADGREELSLYAVDLNGDGVERSPLATIDPTRHHAQITFAAAPAEPLGHTGTGEAMIAAVYDRAAVLFAFEQLGGADCALAMARDYALDRKAFGRAIGSFQAIKHMLANMYVASVLARSNCYYGAWALSTHADELPGAAATARISATQAYQLCAKDAIQVHGGMGFTWDFDCHLHYRRSHLLAVNLGSLSQWEDQLIDHLQAAKQRDLGSTA